MCEHCGDETLSWEEWREVEPPMDGGCDAPVGDPEMDPATGEIYPDSTHICLEDATFKLVWTEPMDHLCEEHKQAKVEMYEESYGEVPGPLGLEEQPRFLGVKNPDGGGCEELVDGGADCGEAVDWVELSSLQWFACDAHRAKHELEHGGAG